MRWPLISAAAVAAAAVLTATGCAGAGASGSSSLGGAAALVPADARVFVALDSDLSSAQWRAVDGLLGAFPARDALLTRLQQAFEKRGKVSWDEDVRPALGPELDLVALRGPPRQVVALTQPADAAKLHALLAKLGGGLVSRQIGGWTAIATSADAFGALAHVTATLADAQPYRDATAELAPEALVHAYTDGSQARRLLLSLPGQAVATTPPARARFRGSGRGISTFATDRFARGAADVDAANDGVRLHAYTRGAPPTLDAIEHARLLLVRTDPYVPLLVDEIPAGVLLVADYQAVSGGFENTPLASLPAWVRRLYAKQPALPNDLDNLLGGETALYVRPGLPAPEITIVTQPPDVERAVEILPEVISALKDQFPQLGQVTVRHAVIGGQLVISSSQQGIAAFRAPGTKLSGDPAFQAAAKAAGLPERTTGFVYANLKAALPLVQLLAPHAGLGDLSALGSLIAYGTKTGAESSYTLFLGVD